MKLTFDRALRTLWFTVGILLLVILGAAIWAYVSDRWLSRASRADPVIVSQEGGAEPARLRAVRYGEPLEIRGTATRLVLVSYGRGYEEVSGYAVSSSGRSENHVNVVFLDASGARPLLDRPAFIREMDFPERPRLPEPLPEDTATRPWISYVMAVEDGDGNGRLDGSDPLELYVTDVDGRNLRRVLEPPLRYHGHHDYGGGRILVYALEPPAGGGEVEEDRMPQRAFLYDVAAGRLQPFAALDAAARRAGEVLAR